MSMHHCHNIIWCLKTVAHSSTVTRQSHISTGPSAFSGDFVLPLASRNFSWAHKALDTCDWQVQGEVFLVCAVQRVTNIYKTFQNSIHLQELNDLNAVHGHSKAELFTCSAVQLPPNSTAFCVTSYGRTCRSRWKCPMLASQNITKNITKCVAWILEVIGHQGG